MHVYAQEDSRKALSKDENQTKELGMCSDTCERFNRRGRERGKQKRALNGLGQVHKAQSKVRGKQRARNRSRTVAGQMRKVPSEEEGLDLECGGS